MADLLATVDVAQVTAVVGALRQARDRGSVTFIVGNGGSAATASHVATDLSNATKRSGQRAIRAISLADNTARLTAIANDNGYDQVFSAQLHALIREDDVLIAISASGNSANVLRAVELARERGALTIALVGFDGGELLRAVDLAVHVRTEPGAYGPVEDVHLAVHHLITACLARA